MDILADYREWQSQQEERIGTHSDDCHLWPRHERCMIHRLAREVERLRGDLEIMRLQRDAARTAIRRLAEQDATLSVQGGNVTVTMDAGFTDEEREAITLAAGDSSGWHRPHAQVLLRLLDRTRTCQK